jgi:ATP-binding cassette subfamily B protein
LYDLSCGQICSFFDSCFDSKITEYMVTATFKTPIQNPPDSFIKKYGRMLKKYLLPQRGRAAWMAILLLVSIGLQLINPQVIRYFLDTATATASATAEPAGSSRALLLAALVFITFALLQQAARLAASLASQRVSWAATNRLRADLVLHCLHLDMSFHKEHTPGEMIERIDGDANQLANFFSQFVVRLLGNGLLVLGILFMLLRENWLVGAGMVLYTILTLSVLGLIQRPATKRWAEARQASAEQFGYIEERISGAEDIRAAGAEGYALQRLYLLMRSFLIKGRAAFVVSTLTWNLTNLVYVFGYAAGLALGVYLFLQGEATLGTAYLIVYYVGMLAEPLQNIREQAQDLQQASASLERVQGLLDLQPLVQDHEQSISLPPDEALGVDFQNVTFGYGQGENILKNVSFTLQPGQVLGILGRTGSGKSTLTRLLFRLYDPIAGSIRLGGRDIRQVSLANLRTRVGMVTQDVQLFDASVRDNLAFFDPTKGEEQIREALHALSLWDWVESLPMGLETKLSAGNQGLSAGEAQLLAFARVFLKDPGLVVLDEASSRLDPVTEARMEKALDRLFAGRTALLIAHRLKTVQRADLILILENGHVVEFGPPQALASDPKTRFYSLLQTGLEEALA